MTEYGPHYSSIWLDATGRRLPSGPGCACSEKQEIPSETSPRTNRSHSQTFNCPPQCGLRINAKGCQSQYPFCGHNKQKRRNTEELKGSQEI